MSDLLHRRAGRRDDCDARDHLRPPLPQDVLVDVGDANERVPSVSGTGDARLGPLAARARLSGFGEAGEDEEEEEEATYSILIVLL